MHHKRVLVSRPGGDGGSAASKSLGGTLKGKLDPRDFIFSGKQKEARSTR